jgi:hypothetical protein
MAGLPASCAPAAVASEKIVSPAAAIEAIRIGPVMCVLLVREGSASAAPRRFVADI